MHCVWRCWSHAASNYTLIQCRTRTAPCFLIRYTEARLFATLEIAVGRGEDRLAGLERVEYSPLIGQAGYDESRHKRATIRNKSCISRRLCRSVIDFCTFRSYTVVSPTAWCHHMPVWYRYSYAAAYALYVAWWSHAAASHTRL